eukprot:8127867-Alexandrium_andersonii.AAC.1
MSGATATLRTLPKAGSPSRRAKATCELTRLPSEAEPREDLGAACGGGRSSRRCDCAVSRSLFR